MSIKWEKGLFSMTASEPPSSGYVINIEAAAETVRLVEQDQLLTQAMGGLFPENPDLSRVRVVLDIGCGPGGWALEVAFRYPHINVIGIDINPTMVEYAFAQARVRKLQNVSFEVMDVRQPLAFPDCSLDLINARLIFSFMNTQLWPTLLAECYRILTPGGIMRCTEAEVAISTSLAQQMLLSYFYTTLARQKRTFSVDGRTTGITHMLRLLLRNAHFIDIGVRPFVLDASYGTPAYHSSVKDGELGFHLIKPYILRMGLVDEAEYDRLYHQMLLDYTQEDFTNLLYNLTVWGCKPIA
jgi:SAM-dependent methyltransferase